MPYLVIGGTESLKKNHFHDAIAINMILIGQVNIPSWGQLGCTQVPRPFLLTAKGLVPRLTKYLVGKMISLFAPGAVDKAAVWSCSSVWPTCNSLKAFSGRILFRVHCKCKATFSLGEVVEYFRGHLMEH